MASRIADYSILGERPSERMVLGRDISAPEEGFAAPKGPARTMHFLVEREPRLLGFWRSVAVLCARTGSLAFHGPIHFFRNQRLSQFKLRPRSFSASVLFHCAMIALLVYLPRVLPAESTSYIRPEIPLTEEIYFRVPVEDKTKPLPKMAPKTASDPAKPADPIKPPDPASSQKDVPKAANTVTYGSLTIVSKPIRPDNFHQTIIQRQSPPDLKIPNDVKVPNIVLVLGRQLDIAKPALDIKLSDSKPLRPDRQTAAVAAPTVAPGQQNPLLPAADAPDIARPKYVPTANDAKPHEAQRQMASVAAPSVAPNRQNPLLPLSNATDIARPKYVPATNDAKPQGGQRQVTALAAPSVTPTVQSPALPVVPLAGATEIARPTFVPSSNDAKPVEAKRQVAAVQAPSVGGAGTQQAALPTGIAQGTVTGLRPPMPVAGSSAPQARHSEGGGQMAAPVTAAAGGGDKVDLVAIGINPADPSSEIKLPPGNRAGEFTITPAGTSPNSEKASGDSNGNPAKTLAANGGTLSITGPHASADGTGMLDPALGANVVFPVPAALLPKARQNHLVVSTGPMGGGGLNLYGAMQCGRIYSVFLEMPKDNWTLQFCEKKPDGAQPAVQSSSGMIQLETPLTPPDAQARFDFQRSPVAPEKAHKLIILRGMIREDGTVDDVKVFQGILPQMDEAARLALSQWKFKPALRDGKPVPLEILVGIPVTATSTP